MKILVVCQYYYPEPFRLHDICEELVRRGHQVTVLTGVPNYPMGEIYEEYRKGKHRTEEIRGVQVIRTWTIPRKTGAFCRMLNYFSFPVSSWLKVSSLDSDIDLVLINQQSPVMMAWPGIRYGRKYKRPLMMYCMDLWPASLTAAGMKPGSPVYGFFHGISHRIYRSMDRILVSSQMFAQYLHQEFGIDRSRMITLPQHAEDVFCDLLPHTSEGPINLVFAGNVGAAQSLDTVLDAARQLKDVLFHIVGDGVELDRLKAKAGENVRFYGRCSVEEMPGYYALADALLVTLKADPVLSFTLPGKVQSYMAAGRPIIGAADGETRRTIEEADCGFCGRAEDPLELVQNIRKFAESKKKAEMGRNARRYYELYFARDRFMDQLEQELYSAYSAAGR